MLQAQAQSNAVDVGQSVLDAKTVAEGLFPEDTCEQLKAAGFKCMGFKPTMRYSLPASSFQVGSAAISFLLATVSSVLRNRSASSSAEM